jgi:hypothetical protein
MLIEAAKGGHTSVVQLLLDYPHSIMMAAPHPHSTTVVPGVSGAQTQTVTGAVSSTGGLHEVPEAVRVVPQEDLQVNASQTKGAAKPSISQAGGPFATFWMVSCGTVHTGTSQMRKSPDSL